VRIVRVDLKYVPEDIQDAYPFDHNEHVLMLGEIENLPGHSVIVNKGGKVIWGYHAEHFVEMTEDEL